MKSNRLSFLALLAMIVLTLSFVACDNGTVSSDTTVPETNSDVQEPTDTVTVPSTEAPTEAPTEALTEAPTEAPTEALTEAETQSPVDILAAFLHSSPDLNSRSRQLATVPSDGVCTIAQGGYTDGKYHYQLFIKKSNETNEEKNLVHMVQYDLEEDKQVQARQPLPLNHANDMTYNSKLGVFVVVHNNPHRNWVSLIDPERLLVIETIDIGMDIYCIAYNEKRDEYAVGLSGGQTFRRLDANFKPVDDRIFQPTPLTQGYTTQGAACDDNFIYFVLYGENVITVYDWDGNFITLIHLEVQGEPENLSVENGTIYVATGYKKKTLVYQIILVKKR